MTQVTKVKTRATSKRAKKAKELEVCPIEIVDNVPVPLPSIDDFVKNSEVKKNYVYMDDTLKVLEMAIRNGRNVILYGKGGHGKSEITVDFFREKGINPFVMTMGSGTSTDRLFGGINLKLFTEEGKIEYLVENSFMNHEYVIFEELFDAPDYILEQLKDILSAGEFRNGTQRFPIKTRLIVSCTNKTREQFSKNDSLRALMERFPLEHEVKWKDYTATTYEHLLRSVRGRVDPMLTYILEAYAKSGIIISPRIAITAADLLESCGPDCLSYIAEFNIKKNILTESVAKFKAIYEIQEIAESLEALWKEIKALNSSDVSDVGDITTKLTTSDNLVFKLSKIKADDAYINKSSSIQKKYTDLAAAKRAELTLTSKLADYDEV